jgi:DNA-binding IclR family transcriptional regulator
MVRKKSPSPPVSARNEVAPWTFLTNHSHVLLCLAQAPDARLRQVADQVGITERAVQRIVRELEDGGYLKRTKEGRRNRYEIDASLPLRHPIERHCQLADLVGMVHGRSTRQR